MNKKKILARSIGAALSFSLIFGAAAVALPQLAHVTLAAEQAQTQDRAIVVTGTVQTRCGAAKDWDPADYTTRMEAMGDGFYRYVAELPAGAYYYKISVNGSWAENYGLGGAFDGPNMALNLDKPTRVTFYYNDMTHKITTSEAYTLEADADLPHLTGLGSAAVTLRDTVFDHFYAGTVTASAGTYDVTIAQTGAQAFTSRVTVRKGGEVSLYFDKKAQRLIVDDGSIERGRIVHDTWSTAYRAPFEAIPAGKTVKLSVATGAGEVEQAELHLAKANITANGGDEYNPDFTGASEQTIAMKKERTAGGEDIWTAEVTPAEQGIYGYYFLLDNTIAYGDDARSGGTGESVLRGAKPFTLTVYDPAYHTPDWAKEAVVYQIFPDRFFNGDKSNDNARKTARGTQPIQHKEWNELPTNHSRTPDLDGDQWECNDFFGGDLAGITAKLDYIQGLGFNAIYVNPIMSACSNHRYDAVDYGNLDPMLGTMADFRRLATELKKRGMHLIMDGVFNHVGDDSIYFDRYGKYEWVGAYEYWSRIYDKMGAGMSEADAKKAARAELLAEGQKFSPYGWENWFEITSKKTSDDMGAKYAYHDWQGFSSLVPFADSDYPDPAGKDGKKKTRLGDYLLYDKKAPLTQWFREGLGGWRLDVAKEVPPHFWRAVRQEVKKQKTVNGDEPLILGEIWQDGTQFLTGDQFDSVMNYKLSFGLGDLFLNRGDAEGMERELTILRQNYPREALYDLMNIVDSHDTIRAIYKLGGGKEGVAQATLNDFDYVLGKARLKLAAAFLMTYPGMPTIYYGDEAGLYGSADPDDRRTFPWGAEDKDLQAFYKKVITLRTANPELFAHGDLATLYAKGDHYAFTRTAKDGSVAITALNRGQATTLTINTNLPNGTKLTDALDKTYSVTVVSGTITVNLPENSVRILMK